MNELVSKDLIDSAPAMSDKRSITIGALVQVFFTLLSRVFGMIRDVMVSHIFGAGVISDAFLIANTIPNVLRQFFGEGAFSVAFVPVYVSTKEKQGQKAAQEFFQDAFGFLLVALLIITTLGIIFSKGMVHLFAFGFAENPEQFELTNTMTKWLFPYIFMISLVALFGAYLACYKRFAAMSAAPILLNVAMIVTMVLWIDMFSPPVMSLVAGVLLGGVLQIGMMLGTLKRANLLFMPTLNFKTEAMKRLLKMLGPALFGIFVYQLNIIVLRQLASFLDDGQITYYYNADRLAQFATGVFAVSIATASLPELSRGMAKYGSEAFFDTLRFTMTITSFIITPCAFGLLVFAHPVISVLFVHGAFTNADAIVTANALMAFAPSLMAFGLSRPLIQAFYAQNDTKTPVLVGIVTVVLNLLIGIALLRFQVVGLSLTLSISSFAQYFLLLRIFKTKNDMKFQTKLLKPFASHAGISIIACCFGVVIARAGDFDLGFTIRNAVVLCALSGAAGTSYFLFAYYFKIPEARKFIDGIRARIFR